MTDLKKYHKPVLLNETLEKLKLKPDGLYVDTTLGEGGHSVEILKRLSLAGMLISIDQDGDAIEFAKSYYSSQKESAQALNSGQWVLRQGNFKDLRRIVEEVTDRLPDGILMDLGMSSRQLERSGRGFSHQKEEEELDMRMNQELGVKAKDLLNALGEKELTRLLREYGEERFAKQIASIIKKTEQPIENVADLNQLIYRAVPAAHSDALKSTASRVYQALRIAVNDELTALKMGLDHALQILGPGGVLVVITFHSLEDRIVKQFIKTLIREKKGISMIPDFLVPSEEEIRSNPRARSAKLRAVQTANL